MTIENYIHKLPWHPTRRWKRRDLSEIEGIIIHQAAGPGDIKAINHYHISPGEGNHISPKGCPHICYTYGIEQNGAIKQCNDLTDITWHAGNVNRITIGILVAGSFDGVDYKGMYEKPAIRQVESLEWLINEIMSRDFAKLRKDPLKLWGHFDFGKPACPGYFLENWIKQKRGY